jgi:hypothetical protein
LRETAALHAQTWKRARSRCMQASQQAMELGTGATQFRKVVSRALAQRVPGEPSG